jgi:hypothetical protein
MDQKFQPGDKVRHKLHQIEYIVISAHQGQQQFFYKLKDENGEIIPDVPEHELEIA